MTDTKIDTARLYARMVAAYGGQPAEASRVGKSDAAVARWCQGVTPVPAEVMLGLERALGTYDVTLLSLRELCRTLSDMPDAPTEAMADLRRARRRIETFLITGQRSEEGDPCD